jgi:hypothetical protein
MLRWFNNKSSTYVEPRFDFLERMAGIEPASQPWEGRVLPLNHTRPRPPVE